MKNTKEKAVTNKKNGRKRKLVPKAGPGNKLRRFLLILFVLLYLPALWNWVFHGSIETAILHTGLLEIKIPSQGVFVRTEVPVFASREGIVVPKVNQGERVPKDYQFAMIVDQGNQQTLRRIESMEREIIRRVMEESNNSVDSDPVFRNKVQNEVNKLTELAMSQDFLSADRIKSTLERLLYQRNKEVFHRQEDRLYLQKEKEELDQLQRGLRSAAVLVQADFSGIVVWDQEPYDDKYQIDNLPNWKTEDLIIKDRRQIDNRLPFVGVDESFSVRKDQSFARLVDNERSWYVCIVDRKHATGIKVDDTLTLKVEGLDILIPAVVERIEATADKVKLILSFHRMVEETIHLRQARADLIINRVQGIKIPLRSLANINRNENTADVTVVRFNRAAIKKVEILAQQDTFAIIRALPDRNDTSPLRVFDIYVVNPQNILEGQVIE